MRPLKTMNAEELSELPFPPPAFIVKDLIPHGLSVLAGASKTGKSWLVLWLAMRVSQGLPVWERPTWQCEVLYLCLEDTFPRIQRRMYRLNEEPVSELRFAVMCDKLHGGLEEQIAEQLRSHPNTGLVIIDTLQKIRDPHDADSGNMYACDYDAMVSLKRVADEHDIGILLVHHIRKTKDSEDPFNEILGSNGVMGGLDTVLRLKREYRGAEGGTLRITGRDVEDQTIPLMFHDCIWERRLTCIRRFSMLWQTSCRAGSNGRARRQSWWKLWLSRRSSRRAWSAVSAAFIMSSWSREASASTHTAPGRAG